MAQWLDGLPPTNVARVQIPDPRLTWVEESVSKETVVLRRWEV